MNTTLERTAGAGLAAATGYGFVREAIEKKLKELRADCAVKRLIKYNSFGRRWARSSRTDEENRRDSGPHDKYWDDKQQEAQRSATAEAIAADKALADFIAEHRPIMGSDWIGNDHGRLCWAHYLGGYPIDQHYCQREEGHEGNCADEWPETRWACESPRGSWPKGVTCDREWRARIESQNGGANPTGGAE